jgi:hypothetical protein
MSRYKGIPDSVYGGNPGFLANGTLNAFITGNVNQGELCTLFESACIKRTDPSLSWSAINKDDPTAVVILIPTLITNFTLTSQTVFKGCGHPERHPQGFYVVPVQTTGGVGFIVRSAAGLQISNFFLVSTDVTTTVPHVEVLANGNFVIIWNASSVLKHCVISPTVDGFSAGGVVTITSIILTSGFVPWFGHCQLANGNFVVTWTTTGNIVQGAIYTNAGVIVGSVFSIDASCQGVHHATQPCANGDFIHYCYDSAHTVFKVYRVTNAGSVTWGPITPSGCGTALFTNPDAGRVHPQNNRIFELLGPVSAPNICVVLPNATQYCNAFILAPTTGALVQQCNIGNDFHDQNFHNPCCQTPAGFCQSHTLSAQSNTYCSFFDFNGNPIHANVICDTGSHQFRTADNPICHTYIGFSNAAVVVTRYAASASLSVEIRCLHVDVTGTIIGVPFLIQGYGPSDCNSPIPICDRDGHVFHCHFSTGTLQLLCTVLIAGRSSVLGVAQASATNGQAVTIVSEGYFQLPATQIFGPGSAFDRRNSTPLGARGVVGGQNAILFGWV